MTNYWYDSRLRLKTKLIFASLFFSLIVVSCCELGSRTRTYSYKDVSIIRVDECAKSTFYYSIDNEREDGMIWAEFSGMSGGFKGYLRFDENGSVELLSGDGYFQVKDIDTSKFNYKRIFANKTPIVGGKIYEINSKIRVEKEVNEKIETDIIVNY